MNTNFDKAFKLTIKHEGGYVNHPNDPGGETNYGISQRAYPALNIKNLTLEQAKTIYQRDYWEKIKGDQLPLFLAVDLFDLAVNSGVKQALMLLQRALKIEEDGILGSKTMDAINQIDPIVLLMHFNAERLDFYTKLATWPTFGKGWVRRIVGNLKMAADVKNDISI